eukprot:comp22627_c0_seq1/m.34775 comp22627_c0_seq1/g.34775  ORF comp22627_c0_seq1/g.34775 comp22627_c0_seq1/m.34775 type:complete len:237 (-) comp22627_c0_seq1:296-1006(-)
MADKASRATLGMAAGLVVVVGALLYLTRPPQKPGAKRAEETPRADKAKVEQQSDLPPATTLPKAPPADAIPSPCPPPEQPQQPAETPTHTQPPASPTPPNMALPCSAPTAPQPQAANERPSSPVGVVGEGTCEVATAVQRVALYAMYEGEGAVAVVGNIDVLGGWNVDKALRLTPTGARGEWRADLSLQKGTQCEFKCILVDQAGALVRWEGIEGNRRLQVDGPMTVRIDVDVQER